jgi:excisionase family DNA binding protein
MERFYSVNEFAALLKIHRNTVYKMIKTRRIHPINIGGNLRAEYKIPEDDLLRLRAETFDLIEDRKER